MSSAGGLVDLPPGTSTLPPTSTSVVKKGTVLFFYAPWHAPSNDGGSIDAVVRALASTHDDDVAFYRIDAEGCTDLSRKYGVTIVPTLIVLQSDGTTIHEKVEGGDDVPRFTRAVSALRSSSSPSSSAPAPAPAAAQPQQQTATSSAPVAESSSSLNDRLKSLIGSSPVMLFMKGNPSEPRCGFSRRAVELLNASNIPFGSFDILSDEDVRQGLKTYSDWPTYPQLYVKGELMGGLDIMEEMSKEDGGLADQLGLDETILTSAAAASAGGEDEASAQEHQEEALNERLKKLVTRSRIVLFMKGLPSAPRCGFSRQICEILDSTSVPYDSFDILSDEEVRQGLKTYSDWPTYPQLYVDGDLIGGLDIVKEMKESGDLRDLLRGAD